MTRWLLQPANVALSKPVPVLFVYVTAWSNSRWTVEFRSDLYRQDGIDELVASYAQPAHQRVTSQVQP